MSDLCPSCGQPGTMLDRQYRGQGASAALWRKRKCPHCGTWETLEIDFVEITKVIRAARKSARAVLRIERELSVFLRQLQARPEATAKAPQKRAVKASPAQARKNGLQTASTTNHKETSHA